MHFSVLAYGGVFILVLANDAGLLYYSTWVVITADILDHVPLKISRVSKCHSVPVTTGCPPTPLNVGLLGFFSWQDLLRGQAELLAGL